MIMNDMSSSFVPPNITIFYPADLTQENYNYKNTGNTNLIQFIQNVLVLSMWFSKITRNLSYTQNLTKDIELIDLLKLLKLQQL